ncbi:MAG: FeoB-associated Cys-rich membrane protein [Lachnospiraceae bacterium]|nr:FeoB-associated Cys-rich membrane protein [Lachnospiraceae bacterium]
MSVILGNAIAILLVVMLVVVCVREIWKGHQSGGCGSCSGGCAGCSGSCASCGGCAHAAQIPKKKASCKK